MNAIVPTGSGGSSGLIPRNMAEAMQLAEMMARGKMVPEHLRNPGDLIMVIDQAMRWQMSPMAVAQATFSIKGRLGYSGTIIHAAVEHCEVLDGLLDYKFSGEGQSRKVRVIGTRRGEKEPKEVEVVLKDAITDNVWWKKTPDQMLVYHGARVWARRWTPGVIYGVYSREELLDAPADTFTGTTIEAKAEPAVDAAPQETASPRKRTMQDAIDEVQAELAAAPDRAAVDVVLATPKAKYIANHAENGAKLTWEGLRDVALTRTAQAPDTAPGDVAGFVARVSRMGLQDLNRLDNNEAHTTWLRSLSSEDYNTVAKAIEARLAELRLGA